VPLAVRIIIAAVAAVLLYLAAVKVIRGLMRPAPPDEPDLSTLRPVDLHYRCMVCGAGVTMTATPGEDDPDPPRHCKEDMVLIEEWETS
jgi:hypothetical protein